MYAYNRLTIINGVLREFGRVPVATPDENDDSKIIDTALDLYLPLFQKSTINFSFLIKNIVLNTPLTQSLSTQFQLTYALPTDFLRPVQFFYGPVVEIWEPYLLTNNNPITMDYLALNLNYEIFPHHFIDCFIYFCAVKLCMGMTRQVDLYENLIKIFQAVQTQTAATEQRLKTGLNTLLNPHSLVASNVISM